MTAQCQELTGHVRIMISRGLVKLLKEYGPISLKMIQLIPAFSLFRLFSNGFRNKSNTTLRDYEGDRRLLTSE